MNDCQSARIYDMSFSLPLHSPFTPKESELIRHAEGEGAVVVGVFGCEEGCLGLAGEVVEVGIDIAAATEVFVELYGSIEMGLGVEVVLAVAIDQHGRKAETLSQQLRRC